MPHTTFAGHPLHPQLVAFPLGLLPFSFAMDVLHHISGEDSYANAAYYSMAGGCLGAVAAGAAGAADYFSIPDQSKSKKVANIHATLNGGLMGIYGLSLLLRRGHQPPTSPLAMLLSGLGCVGLIASAWYGGELVYQLGMRVKPAMGGDESPELKIPGDQKIENALRAVEDRFAGGNGRHN